MAVMLRDSDVMVISSKEPGGSDVALTWRTTRVRDIAISTVLLVWIVIVYRSGSAQCSDNTPASSTTGQFFFCTRPETSSSLDCHNRKIL